MRRLALPMAMCAYGFACTATTNVPAPQGSQSAEQPAVTTTPAPTAYPTAPTSATLTPAPGVASLELPCGEQDRENGVDDDCDGRIDESADGKSEARHDAALQLTLTWTGPAQLSLDTEPSLAAAPTVSDCETDAACTLRLTSAKWQGQVLALRVTRDAAEQPPAALTASLCAAAQGQWLGCHNFTLAPGQTREVAALAVP